jgi:hypothetical protein
VGVALRILSGQVISTTDSPYALNLELYILDLQPSSHAVCTSTCIAHN